MTESISSREAAHRAASDQEQVAWVDESDRYLGSLPRHELRERGLIGRGTFVFLFNAQKELCVHRRTFSKALYPGYWDPAAGGMVQAGESYGLSAQRELGEELGIRDASLHDWGRFLYQAPENRLWCGVFSACSDAPLRLQPEEVLEARFMTLADVMRDAQTVSYCPDSMQALMFFRQQRERTKSS